MKCNDKITKYQSFQVMESVIQGKDELIRLINVYRPGYSKKAKHTQNFFFGEFSDYLSSLSEKSGKPILMGDFNFHMECIDDAYTKKMNNILEEYNLVQCCPLVPTHEQGGTLDLLITSKEMKDRLQNITISESVTGTDHYLVTFDLEMALEEKMCSK